MRNNLLGHLLHSRAGPIASGSLYDSTNPRLEALLRQTVFRTARDQLFGEDRKALEEISRKGVLPTTQETR